MDGLAIKLIVAVLLTYGLCWLACWVVQRDQRHNNRR